MNAVQHFLRNTRGGTAVEFAIVAPTFLMMIFLMLDGGRMLFTKQALNDLAIAGARCMALQATGCANATAAQTWVIARARQRSQLVLTTVTIDAATSCNGQTNMAKARIDYTYKKGPLNLLPQSAVPSTLTSISCFPVAVAI